MAGKGPLSGRSVSTGRVAVGRLVLDVGAPGGTTVRSVRMRRSPPPPDLAAALHDEDRPAVEVVDEAIDTAAEVTDEVDRAAKLFTDLVRGSLDLTSIAGHLERLLGLLLRLFGAGRYRETLQVAHALSRLLTLAGKWAALVETLRVAEQAARELRDSEALAWVLHELGTLAFGAEDAQAAEADLGEAQRLRAAHRDEAGLAATTRNLRALRRPYAPQIAKGGAALALGTVLALVIAAGVDPDPDPPTTGAASVTQTTQTTQTTSPPPPSPGPVDETRPRVTLRLAGGVSGPSNDPAPAFTGSGGTQDGDRPQVIVRIRPADGGGDPVPALRAELDADGSFDVRAAPLPSGTYTARAEQRDDAGNTGRSDRVSFTIDVDAPVVTIATPDPGARTGESIVFSGTAEPDAGAVTLRPTAESEAIEVEVGPDGRWRHEATVQSVLEQGDYKQFSATATQTDAAGNTGTDTVAFTPAPVVD